MFAHSKRQIGAFKRVLVEFSQRFERAIGHFNRWRAAQVRQAN